jgi:hypothetical protein
VRVCACELAVNRLSRFDRSFRVNGLKSEHVLLVDVSVCLRLAQNVTGVTSFLLHILTVYEVGECQADWSNHLGDVMMVKRDAK